MPDFQKLFDAPPAVRGVWSRKWDYRLEQTGEADVQPMWIADMDFETPQAVKDAVIERAQLGVYGYTAVDKEYHDAVIAWQRDRHGWEVAEEWILHTPSVIFGIQTAVRALTDRDDYVLVQPPVYHPFFRLLRQTHRRILENPLIDRGDHYEIDWDDFERKLRDYRPKLFLLCNPHNPVGKVYTPEELRQFGDLCQQYGVTVVADEIHGDLTLPGVTHTPFATLGEAYAQNAVICTAASKTFNLAGLHLSNIIVPNTELRRRMQDTITETGLPGPNLFALTAGNAAFRYGAPWLDALREYLAENRKFAAAYVSEFIPALTVYQAEGTYFLWLDCRKLGLDNEALEQFLLHKAGIWANQGHIFGAQGSGFVRLNLALPRQELAQALEKLALAVKAL